MTSLMAILADTLGLRKFFLSLAQASPILTAIAGRLMLLLSVVGFGRSFLLILSGSSEDWAFAAYLLASSLLFLAASVSAVDAAREASTR